MFLSLVLRKILFGNFAENFPHLCKLEVAAHLLSTGFSQLDSVKSASKSDVLAA